MKPIQRLLLTVATLATTTFSQSMASPVLVSSIPDNAATGVAVSSDVSFTFDSEMLFSPALFMSYPPYLYSSLQWSPNLNFTYAMSADSMTLICTPTGPLPANTQITWTLNPSNATMDFEDLDGNPLPTITGSFTTAGSSTPSTGTNVCTLFKTLAYYQTDASTVSPATNVPAFFNATVMATNGNPISAAALLFPGSSQPMALSQLPGQSLFTYNNYYNSQALLDTAIPAGTYTFSLLRQSGQLSVVMNVSTMTDYAPVPKINNFDATQAVDPAKAFTFTWTPISGVQPLDNVQFVIDSDSGEIFSSSNTLANTAGSITIPANKLAAGKTYDGYLGFVRTVYQATNATDQVVSVASLLRSTHIFIKTTGGTSSTPKFAQYGTNPNGKFSLTLSAPAGSTLKIESSATLSGWQTVLTTNVPANGTVIYQDVSSADAARFYRANVQ